MIHINHIGIAVNCIEEVLPVYRDLFPGLTSHMEPVTPESTLKTLMIETGTGTLLELLEPIAPDSTIARYLSKHGEGIHHIAFEVDDIFETCEMVKRKGYRVLGEISTGVGGTKIFFVHPKDTHGVLMEFVSRHFSSDIGGVQQ